MPHIDHSHQAATHSASEQSNEPASEYMSIGKESAHKHQHGKLWEPWMHPEKLSAEERDKLVNFVPKDTIELLKEGH